MKRGLAIASPVRPNYGTYVLYKRRLLKLVNAMHKSVMYWVVRDYESHLPKEAVDAMPMSRLLQLLGQVTRRWQKAFNQASTLYAKAFTKDVAGRTDTAMKEALRASGMSIKFKPTKAMRDVARVTVKANAQLIRSIPQQYLGKVEGSILRSVQSGGDLKALTDDLTQNFGVARHRAILIARHQNAAATAAMHKVRQLELGIIKAVWAHSGGGHEPRPSHVKAGRDKVVYDVRKGWFDPHEQKYIQPGELINCGCYSRSIIPGLDTP